MIGKRANASLVDLPDLKATASELRIQVELEYHIIGIHGGDVKAVVPDFIHGFMRRERIIIVAARPGQRQRHYFFCWC